MKKNGFTLVELLVVIAALAIVLLIAMPVVGNILDSAKQKAHDRQLELILKAMEQHVTNDIRTLEWDEDEYSITLKDLSDLGYIKLPIKDPIAKNGNFDELMCLDATREATGDISYKIGNTCTLQPTLVAGQTGKIVGNLYEAPYLKANGPILRNQIESIDIVNNKDIPSDTIGSYDVSEVQDGSVMLWYKTGDTAVCGTSETEQCYKVYIGASKRVYANPDSSYLFGYLVNLVNINLSYLNTSKVTDMSYMFSNAPTNSGDNYGSICRTSKITGLDLKSFDTSKVTSMDRMFNCLTSLTNLNISSFDTSQVTSMRGMFEGLEVITNLDISNFDTSKVEDMSGMFTRLGNSTLNLSALDTSNVIDMSRMFSGMENLTTIQTLVGNNIINFDTSKVTEMNGMFSGNDLSNLEFGSKFVTNNVEDMMYMFYITPNLTTIKHTGGNDNVINFDTSQVTSMRSMFEGNGLSNLEFGSKFVTDEVTSMWGMFRDMQNLTTIRHSGGGNNVINFNTSKVTNMSVMFQSDRLSNLEFGSNFDTSKVTDMDSIFGHMLNIVSLDIRYFDFSKVTSHAMMLYNVPLTVKITVNSAGNDWLNNNGYSAWNIREISP